MSKQTIKAAIDAQIKQNGRRYITGNIMNAILNLIVDGLGSEEELLLKQDKLIPGPGITIAEDGKTISSQGGGSDVEVIDSLDSDSASDALSARMGKTLRGMISSLPAQGRIFKEVAVDDDAEWGPVLAALPAGAYTFRQDGFDKYVIKTVTNTNTEGQGYYGFLYFDTEETGVVYAGAYDNGQLYDFSNLVSFQMLTSVREALEVAIGRKANSSDVYTKSQADARFLTQHQDISGKADKTYVDTELGKKVDKVSGKGLSSNDFTSQEKLKLAGLSNYDDTEIRGIITTLENDLDETNERLNDLYDDYLNASNLI